MSGPDVKALEALVEWAAHSDRWDQQYYAARRGGPECKTAFCLAGMTCLMIGEDDFAWQADGTAHNLSDGRSIPDVARNALGLRPMQGALLFQGTNTIEDIRRHVRNIIEAEKAYA